VRPVVAERHGKDKEEKGKYLELLKKFCIESSSFLGVPSENVSFGDYTYEEPFSCADIEGNRRVPSHITEVIKKIAPTVVFTHHSGDAHRDHRIVHKATMIATRPMLGTSVKHVFSYETPSSTDQSFQTLNNLFSPNYYTDINGFLDKKLEAFSKYLTESKGNPSPRSPEKIKALASVRGAQIFREHAEAFTLLRGVDN
jgi:LmbE family N-acetylglucosaminyl deacetylase